MLITVGILSHLGLNKRNLNTEYYPYFLMNKNTHVILGLGGVILLLAAGVLLPHMSNPDALAQSKTTLADRSMSYLTQAETSIIVGNIKDA
jgi:hypothetical protein